MLFVVGCYLSFVICYLLFDSAKESLPNHQPPTNNQQPTTTNNQQQPTNKGGQILPTLLFGIILMLVNIPVLLHILEFSVSVGY